MRVVLDGVAAVQLQIVYLIFTQRSAACITCTPSVISELQLPMFTENILKCELLEACYCLFFTTCLVSTQLFGIVRSIVFFFIFVPIISDLKLGNGTSLLIYIYIYLQV
ncbi:hypothetical protein ACJX0J_030258 [Zea mays]